MSSLPRLVKERVIADMFQVTVQTVRRWERAGHIPSVRVGRTVRYDVDAVSHAIRDAQESPKQQGVIV